MTRLSRRHLLAALATAGCGSRELSPGEMSLWFTYGGRNRKVLLELVDRFHGAQSKVKVQPTFQGDYFEGLVKLRTGLFVGSTPTVTHVIGEVVPYLAEAGVLSPLSELEAEVKADIDPVLGQAGSFVGGDERPLYALPFNRSTPVAYYNKNAFQEAGLKPPTIWAEMREVARALTRRNGNRTERWGFECPIAWWFWIAMLGQAGGRVIEADGRVSLGGDAGVEALQHWQTMIHRDRSMKPPPGRDFNAWEATNSDFLAGRVAMIWTSTAFLSYLTDNASFELGVAPLPQQVRFSVPTGGTFFVMPAGVKGAEREAGLAFLRFMMSPASANHWATNTGYMPVSLTGRQRLEAQGFFDANPDFKVTLDQLAYAQAWPWAPELFRVQREAVQPRLEQAVLQQKDGAAMLAEARASLREAGIATGDAG